MNVVSLYKQLNNKVMCLKLKNSEVKPQIAENDIVVYKHLEDIKCLSPDYDGKEFTGIIKGIEVSGKISIENDEIFFCNDNVKGSNCENKHGFKYSWFFDHNVESISVDGVEIIKNCKILNPVKLLVTTYQRFPVEIGKTYYSKLGKWGNEIERGLHSFKYLKACKSENSNAIYVKCIIPKGSTYYTGRFDRFISYASDKLTYVEFV